MSEHPKCEACGLQSTAEYIRVRTTNGGLLLCVQCLGDINRKNPARKLASWLSLLLRAVREWDVSWKREWGGVFVGGGHPSKDRTLPCEFDSEGRPIENAELRAAIEGCLDPSPQPTE